MSFTVIDLANIPKLFKGFCGKTLEKYCEVMLKTTLKKLIKYQRHLSCVPLSSIVHRIHFEFTQGILQ